MKAKRFPNKNPLRIDVLTIFPKMVDAVLSESLIGKARDKKLLDLRVVDIRAFSDDKHKTVDDRLYGGGAGMLLKPEPLYRALRSVGVPHRKKRGKAPWVIYLSPQGNPFTQKIAEDLSKRKHLVLLCGHYEGIDERLFRWIDSEISLGEVVYTGGEIPALAVVDATARLIPGVVKESDSVKWDSFSAGWKGLLDCPHYTRPAVWRGQAAPDVLLSGDHEKIRQWRLKESIKNTRQKRPDLLK